MSYKIADDISRSLGQKKLDFSKIIAEQRNSKIKFSVKKDSVAAQILPMV